MNQAEITQINDQIKREGLNPRQLRAARRSAQRHGLAVRGDYDAVRQLRAMGIDPFSKSGMLQTVANENATYALGQVERVQLPQTVAQAPAPAQYAPRPHNKPNMSKTPH